MDMQHRRMGSLRRALLLGGASLAAGFALSLVGASAASAADDDTDSGGLLGAVASATDAVSSTVADIDATLTDVVATTAQVAEPVLTVVQAVAPAPAAAVVPPVVESAESVTQSAVDQLGSAANTAVTAVDEVVESEPVASVTDGVVSGAAEVPIAGVIVDTSLASTVMDVVSSVSSRLDCALEAVVGDSVGPAVTIPEVPTRILDGIVGVIVPVSPTAPGSAPVPTGAGPGADSAESSVITALRPPGDSRDPSVRALGASAGGSATDPPAGLSHPPAVATPPGGGTTTLPGSCTVGGGSASAGAGALHAALPARPLTTLCAGAVASVSSDAVPAAPVYPTDVSPD